MTDQLFHLLTLYRNGTLSPEQARELSSLLDNEKESQEFAMLVQQQLEQKESNLPEELDLTSNRILDGLMQKIVSQQMPEIKVRRTYSTWYWAAASLLLVLAGWYTWMHIRKPDAAQTTIAENRIGPGTEGAILTLADGSQLLLDSLGNGTVATQNGVAIVLEDGRLTYADTGSGIASLQFNTIATPKGRQFKLILPDSTSVWLNAGSSLKYPTRFNHDERRVTLQGEAYFEVKKSGVPFRVSIDEQTELEVLGTAFNINDYANEAYPIATLVEGRVLVRKNTKEIKLSPGQQALLAQNITLNTADLDKVIAWKNGYFYCEGIGLYEMMRQLERWYDIEVEYEPGVKDVKFTGRISRNVQLSDLLSGLEKSGVRFRMENRKLIVIP